jgi:hypothetical protein
LHGMSAVKRDDDAVADYSADVAASRLKVP